MLKLSWKDWLGVVGVALLVAVLAFLSLLQFQHWRQDDATLHAMIQLLNYNVAQGKLVTMPVQPPPAVEPATPPKVP